MLEQFTWQQFLVAALALTTVWYAGVGLIFYRKELQAFLNKGRNAGQANDPLPHRWEKGVETLATEPESEAEDEMMGKSRLPEGMSTVGTDEFGFAPVPDEKQQQVGLVPDVLEEIKKVFVFLAEEDGTKKDFFSLMEEIKSKYPQVASSPNVPRINEFIMENAPFHLSQEEVDNLWG